MNIISSPLIYSYPIPVPLDVTEKEDASDVIPDVYLPSPAFFGD